MEEQAAAALAAKYGTPITVAGGSAAAAFGYDANTIGMIAGIIIGIAGLVVTWYYKRKADKRHIKASDEAAVALAESRRLEREAHALQMEVFRKQLNEPSAH
jgi:Na+/glutamate symporter